jgi:DNA-directed RNA polymerase specialized sigma24 family protein
MGAMTSEPIPPIFRSFNIALVKNSIGRWQSKELEARHELEALVKQLPLHYSEAITLYYFEHFTYQEIAYLLNLSMGTVKAHLHRGIQRLRQACITREHETRSIDGTNAAP